jgi:hypothetical protein
MAIGLAIKLRLPFRPGDVQTERVAASGSIESDKNHCVTIVWVR